MTGLLTDAEVTRYELEGTVAGPTMQPHDKGQWVHYDDYCAQAARIEELEEKIVGQTCCCSVDESEDMCMHHSPMLMRANARIEELEARIEMLDAALSAVGTIVESGMIQCSGCMVVAPTPHKADCPL